LVVAAEGKGVRGGCWFFRGWGVKWVLRGGKGGEVKGWGVKWMLRGGKGGEVKGWAGGRGMCLLVLKGSSYPCSLKVLGEKGV